MLFLILTLITKIGYSQTLEPFPMRSCHDGWKDYDNYDIFGHDLTFGVATHPTECFVMCDNIENCHGFTYGEAFVGHRCYFKTEGATEVIKNEDVYSAYRCDVEEKPKKEEKFYEKLWVQILSGSLLFFLILIIILFCFCKRATPLHPIIRYFDVRRHEVHIEPRRPRFYFGDVELGVTGNQCDNNEGS